MPRKLLVSFAHPDDELMGMGATLAKYAAQGVETYYVCATRGERGWFGPEEQRSRAGEARSDPHEGAGGRREGTRHARPCFSQLYRWRSGPGGSR